MDTEQRVNIATYAVGLPPQSVRDLPPCFSGCSNGILMAVIGVVFVLGMFTGLIIASMDEQKHD